MEKLSFEESCRSREMLAVKRGREVIVSVEADREVNTVYVRGNGKVEGSVPLAAGKASLADLPTQVLLGKLAVDLLHGESGRRALLIGLGSGVTLGALLEGAESVFAAGGIDVIEIEPAYLDAIRDPAVRPFVAPFLPETILAAGAAPSRAPGAAPCSFHFGDARRLLAGELGERRWRVIVSQPSEPWIPGAAALFTVEFFEQAAARLDGDGGLFLQWLQMARVDAAGLELLVRTFRRAFGSVFVLRPPRTGELILVGANGAVHLERLLEAPAGRFFAAAGLEVLADRLAVFLAGPRGVEEWVDLEPGGPVNTDGRSEALYRLAVVHQAGRDPLEENLARLRLLAARDPVARYLPEPLRHDARLLRLLAARNRILGDAEEADAILRGLRED
jgi:spermidine synthase